MKVTITSIELKGPLKFFALSLKAMNIIDEIIPEPVGGAHRDPAGRGGDCGLWHLYRLA